MHSLLALLFIMLTASSVFANCVIFDLTTWTSEQRGKLSHVVAIAANDTIKLQRLPDKNVEVCAPTADLSGLSAATLQTATQAILDAQATASTTRQTQLAEARTEVETNTLCNGSLADVITRIDAEKAAIQSDINAATDLVKARTALTTINNRYGAALRFIARCIKGRATLQGQEN